MFKLLFLCFSGRLIVSICWFKFGMVSDGLLVWSEFVVFFYLLVWGLWVLFVVGLVCLGCFLVGGVDLVGWLYSLWVMKLVSFGVSCVLNMMVMMVIMKVSLMKLVMLVLFSFVKQMIGGVVKCFG